MVCNCRECEMRELFTTPVANMVDKVTEVNPYEVSEEVTRQIKRLEVLFVNGVWRTPEFTFVEVLGELKRLRNKVQDLEEEIDNGKA